MVQADVTPVAQPQRIGKPGDPCVMVIFGATGDLTRRKLVPALYNLAKYELLSREFAIVGVAHNPMSTDDFRKKVSDDLKEFVGNDVDPDSERVVHPAPAVCHRRLRRQERLSEIERLARTGRQGSLHPRQLFFLSGDFRGFLRTHRRTTCSRRLDGGKQPALAASHYRETLRA